MTSVLDIFRGAVSLWSVSRCYVCGHSLGHDEHEVCNACLATLPRTNFEIVRDNSVERLFWGRVRLHSAFSAFYYRKGQMLPKLIHAFKYRNNTTMAKAIGRVIGRMAKRANMHTDYDFLVPVPLHPKRLAARGYNQSLYIAYGIAEETNLIVNEDIIERNIFVESQTRKSRTGRWDNVKDVFSLCDNARRLAGARLLLVDDVLTTGATTEACCSVLATIPYVRIGLITIGVTSD